jgi:hypothetical protein
MKEKSFFWIQTIVPLVLLVSLFLSPTVTNAQLWYDANWPYRKAITIDSTQVDATLTNFPLLVDISDTDLALDAQFDGADILFTGDDGATKLDHEIESYAAGDLVAWVKVPSLLSSPDTVIYLYYGNAGAPNQENPTGVWDANYVMVQHLEELSGPHNDSTSNLNNSNEVVVTNQTATGKINGADEFNGSTDYVRVPDDASLQFGVGSLTAEAWINPISVITDSGGARIVNNRGTGVGGSYAGWQFKIKNEAGSWRFSDTGIDDGALPYEPYEGSNTYPYNDLYQVVMVYDAVNVELRFYVDGQLDGSLSLTPPYGSITNSLPTVIGASIYDEGTLHGEDKQFFDGIIDEVRLSNEVRSAEWIQTGYTNQNNPSGFYLLGEEEVSDADEDGVPYDVDNCPNYPNGPLRGTCTEVVGVNWIVSTGQFCTVDADCGDSGKFCEKTQADNYPPGGNGIGDACDCEADFDCDSPGLDVDASNVEQFLWDFGRSLFNNPCSNDRFCFGDFTCDSDVDADDIPKLLEDFGRSLWENPCPTPPACVPADWCVYVDP